MYVCTVARGEHMYVQCTYVHTVYIQCTYSVRMYLATPVPTPVVPWAVAHCSAMYVCMYVESGLPNKGTMSACVCVTSTSAVTDLIIRDVISVYVCCRMLFVMSIAGQ